MVGSSCCRTAALISLTSAVLALSFSPQSNSGPGANSTSQRRVLKEESMRRANRLTFPQLRKRLCAQQHTIVAVLETVSLRETVFQRCFKVRGKKHIVSIAG